MAAARAPVAGRKRGRADDAGVGWAALPEKILLRVLAKLTDAVDIVYAGEVNKHWHHSSCTPQLWRCVDLSKKMFKNKLTDGRFLTVVKRAAGPLESLRLHDAQMLSYTRGIMPILAAFAPLRRLSLRNVSISYEGLVSIVQVCTNLTDLELNQSNVTDTTLKAISEAPYASRLTSLNLRASTLITDEGLEPLLRVLKSVRVLDLSWCCELTGASVDLITSTLPALEVLNLRWCRKLPWSAIPVISHHLRNLKGLNVSHIAKGIPKLPEMDVRGAQEYILALSKMSTLTHLDIAGLPFSTMPDCITALSRALPQLKEFSYRPENQKHSTATAIQQQRRDAAEVAAQKELKELNEEEGQEEEVMLNIV